MNFDARTETLIKAKIGEEAFDIERVYFVKTDRKSNPRKINPFRYFEGSLPVLVSAPHAVRHIRHKKIKPSDEFTGSMAYILNKITSCHSLAVTKLYGGDPNFDDKCIYKDLIKNICTANRLKLVIDIHGASKQHDFDIDIGTMEGISLLNKTCYTTVLKDVLKNHGITRISENYFTVSGQNTVTSYVSQHLGVPALQLEINKRFRAPNQNPEDYCRMVGVLAEFVHQLSS
ncbi:hypothetical protein [Phosphitispora sp. TUW77]|uniref:hypothetical protein n=1 Tax=Phosphitispora sp. TUW77 TaxID=3152361 RepID=UPI003AB84B3F